MGLEPTTEARAVLARLSLDAPELLEFVREVAANRAAQAADVPDVDAAVDEALSRAFPSCLEPELLRKRQRTGRQNRVLLAHLLAHLNEPVSLHELLLVNGLHNATSRRLRELRVEHGHFDLVVSGTGDTTSYTLRSAAPDVDATARYWLLRNIRQASPKSITPHRRLLALLSAFLNRPVAIDDLAYVLPKRDSPGRGRARSPQLAVARRVRELRERGWQVQAGSDRTRQGLSSSEYLLTTLDRLPEYERISAKVRDEALINAGHRCELCGWGPADPPVRGKKHLEVHHRNPQRARPEDVNDSKNLQTLCNVCHAGVESRAKRRAKVGDR